MLKDFRQFLLRGNVLDLAIGVIIGGTFGSVITSLVNDVLMPPIGMLMGKVDFKQLKVVLQPEGPLGVDGKPSPAEVAISYGLFLNTMINFVIVAFCIFMVVKLYNRMTKHTEEEAAPAGPTDVELLTEIRDVLKAKA